ncbi:MAG: DUF4383 domain-containing protein [Patescibacteria group bacterium]
MATLLSWVLGAVLTLVGVAGFVMESPLLGLFAVDPVHNIIHILSGLVGLFAASKGEGYARQYLIVFGVIYAVVAVLGFVMDGNILGLLMVNMEDNYLHGVIALASLGVAFAGKRRSAF